jgi:selenocysteine-specific elongation factor
MPGETGYARIHLDGDAVVLLPGDRFVLRGFARIEGAGATYGGGSVLDIAPPHRRLSDPDLLRELEVLHTGDRSEAIFERVRRMGYAGVDARDVARETGLAPAALAEILAELAAAGRIAQAGAHQWLDAAVTTRMQQSMLDALEAFHTAEPMRPGMPRATLRARLPKNVPAEASGAVLASLEASGAVLREGDVVRRADHRPTLDDRASQAVARILTTAQESGLEPPNPREWAEALGVPLDDFRDLVAHLEREGHLVRAPGDLWFAKSAVDALSNKVIEHFVQSPELDTQTYKGLIGTSRRTAMPLMELLDELHITRRQGDVRVRRSGS